MKLPRLMRLLPSVVVVTAGLLVLKTTDLVHEAYAQVSDKVAAITADPKPVNADYAGGDEDQIASASEVDVTNSLGKRRRELDARQQQLEIQANMIAAAESRVDAKIAQLKTLQSQIAALLGQRDEAQKAQIAALVKTYSAMKPADAARIFNTLPDGVLVPVAHDMKSDVLGQVLSKMNPDSAKALTVKLADKLALPQSVDAPAPPPTAAAAPAAATAAAAPATAPGPQASAAAASATAKPATASPAPDSAAKPKT